MVLVSTIRYYHTVLVEKIHGVNLVVVSILLSTLVAIDIIIVNFVDSSQSIQPKRRKRSINRETILNLKTGKPSLRVKQKVASIPPMYEIFTRSKGLFNALIGQDELRMLQMH